MRLLHLKTLQICHVPLLSFEPIRFAAAVSRQYFAIAAVLASRVCDYAPTTKCGPPGPKWEVNKKLLFQGVYELDFDLVIRLI